jgi:hypothetical protein
MALMVAPLTLFAKDSLLGHTGDYFSGKQAMMLARAGASGDSETVADLISKSL